MEEQVLAEKISQAIDFNLSQIFNEIDLKVKSINQIKAESLKEMKPAVNESRILVFSELKGSQEKIKAVISFNKENALMMADLIKGASFGATKNISIKEMNALKTISSNLFKAAVNSLNSVLASNIQFSETKVIFSFSAFENELIAGNLTGTGKLFELSLIVGGTNIKGKMKFFASNQMIK